MLVYGWIYAYVWISCTYVDVCVFCVFGCCDVSVRVFFFVFAWSISRMCMFVYLCVCVCVFVCVVCLCVFCVFCVILRVCVFVCFWFLCLCSDAFSIGPLICCRLRLCFVL